MELHGRSLIGFDVAPEGGKTFRAYNPREGKALEPPFSEAGQSEVQRAMELAGRAAPTFAARAPEDVAAFLLAIRDEWAIATSGGRPWAVRGQALAFLLLVVVAAGTLTTGACAAASKKAVQLA